MGETWGETCLFVAGVASQNSHVSPKIHPLMVKHEIGRNCMINNNIYIFYIRIPMFHPYPHAIRPHTCARGGWVKGESWSSPTHPRRSHHVCAGSTISSLVGQPYGHALVRQGGAEHQYGQHGQDAIGTPPTSVSEDRMGNGLEDSFCLLRVANINF
jgi:hypothetical protein